ncbi:MAG: metallopeptidase family protein [Clostridiales Family XIII bacterium]|jgi:predicted Zn-dependent protease with MMP-like domain|nr:metallopeptidase family protein [Clostridiales Family XIII bacterium]
MMTLDEMQDVLDELAEELPQEFYRELNGGIVLLEGAKQGEYSLKPGDLYTLGEYHHGGGMGNYIKIYYGSFERVYGHLPDEAMKDQLRKTLRHEFRHHMEFLAGDHSSRSLEAEDARFIDDYLARRGVMRGRKKGKMPRL